MGIIEKQSIQDIANAIRNRNGLTTLYKPREMDEAILNLYSTTKVNNMLDYILPCYEKEATSYTVQYADADRPGSISKLEGNTIQNGTPTPTSPIEVKTVSGDNEVVVSNEQHVTGNSYRVDFGGGNQLPQDKYIESRTTNGITYTNNGNGTFSLSGTASANTSIQIIPYNNINIQNGKSYYLLSNVPYNSNTFNMSVRFKEDTTQRYLIANGTVTVSSTATISNVDLAFWINSGNTVNAQNVKLMLVEGNTAPSRYSPYVSNPIELCKIGSYVDKLKKSTGKNLFNKDDVENDKRLDSSGQPITSSASGFSLTNYIKVEPDSKYTYSRNTTSSSYYVNICEYTSDKTHIQRLYKAGDTTTTFTFTTPSNCYYLRINDATTNLYSIQLELRRNCNKSRTLWSR